MQLLSYRLKTHLIAMKYHLSIWLWLAIWAPVVAQLDLPSTQVYAFDIEQENDSIWHFTNARYLSAFNPHGYNNQPAFISNDLLLLTVGLPDSNQTDIYQLDLRQHTLLRVTATLESEFSPSLMSNKLYFSAVRVETDEGRTQRLWRFPLDRLGYGQPVFPYLRRVGYYCWLDHKKVGVFIVNDPPLLIIADAKDESTRPVISDIGRGLQRLPNGHLAFVHKERPDAWFIKSVDPYTLDQKYLVACLPGSEDFAVMPDGTLLQPHGSKLYKFRPGRDKHWVLVADFKNYRMAKISRIAISPDSRTLVLVALPGKE